MLLIDCLKFECFRYSNLNLSFSFSSIIFSNKFSRCQFARFRKTQQHYSAIYQHRSGRPEEDHAAFISQCQQVCLALIESVTNHTPLNYQAQSQSVQGLADLLIGECEPLVREVLASPELVHACTLFVAVKFGTVLELRPEELCALGDSYAAGKGEIKNEKLAVALYQQAAHQGLTEGILNLGLCYLVGTGVEKNAAQAATCFQQVADQGSTDAIFNLGMFNMHGIGVPQDVLKGVAIYQLAANQGHVHAIYNLGLCYLQGQGVSQSEARAVAQFQKGRTRDQMKPALI